MRRLFSLLALLALLALACGATSTLTPAPDVGNAVAQTLTALAVESILTQSAQTVESALTQAALPPPPTQTFTPPPAATDTPTVTPTATPEEMAPDPLPAAYTGVILNVGECFDFDTGQVSLPDQRCDLWLDANINLHQINGALLSGYATFTPPSRSHCVSARHDPGYDVSAVQTDLYMCFTSSESRYGFMVAREYRGSIPYSGIVFDYWVFR